MSETSTATAQGTTEAVKGTEENTAAKQTPDTKSSEGKSNGDEGNGAATNAATEGTPGKSDKVVPEKYDLRLPENSLLDQDAVEKTVAFAKERGLSNEEAQALIDRDNANIAAYVSMQKQTLTDAAEKWMDAVKNDKEIGGEGFKRNAELAKRVVTRYGSDDLRKALDASGLGNHPELVRMLVRIGQAMSDDQLVTAGRAPAGKKSAEELLYGEQPKKE